MRVDFPIFQTILASVSVLCAIFSWIIVFKSNRCEVSPSHHKSYNLGPDRQRFGDYLLSQRVIYFLLSGEDKKKLIAFQNACSLYAHFEIKSSFKSEAYLFSFSGQNLEVCRIFSLPIWFPVPVTDGCLPWTVCHFTMPPFYTNNINWHMGNIFNFYQIPVIIEAQNWLWDFASVVSIDSAYNRKRTSYNANTCIDIR